jgi:hypothetical protein
VPKIVKVVKGSGFATVLSRFSLVTLINADSLNRWQWGIRSFPALSPSTYKAPDLRIRPLMML